MGEEHFPTNWNINIPAECARVIWPGMQPKAGRSRSVSRCIFWMACDRRFPRKRGKEHKGLGLNSRPFPFYSVPPPAFGGGRVPFWPLDPYHTAVGMCRRRRPRDSTGEKIRQSLKDLFYHKLFFFAMCQVLEICLLLIKTNLSSFGEILSFYSPSFLPSPFYCWPSGIEWKEGREKGERRRGVNSEFFSFQKDFKRGKKEGKGEQKPHSDHFRLADNFPKLAA